LSRCAITVCESGRREKLEIVKQTNELGNFVSIFARQFGITAARFFLWRKA
jgi:transposase-like protein